jgi:hypothetical protein
VLSRMVTIKHARTADMKAAIKKSAEDATGSAALAVAQCRADMQHHFGRGADDSGEHKSTTDVLNDHLVCSCWPQHRRPHNYLLTGALSACRQVKPRRRPPSL